MGNRPAGEGLTGRGWKIPLPCLLVSPVERFTSINPRRPAATAPSLPCLIVSPGTSFQRPSLQRDVIKPGGDGYRSYDLRLQSRAAPFDTFIYFYTYEYKVR